MTDSPLKKLRKSRGLTLEDVAAGVNSTAPTIHKIETGKRRLTWDWQQRLARFYNIDPTQIPLGGKPPIVQVAGYIGAGAEVIPFDDHAKGAGLDEVTLPRGLNPDKTVAVRVRGDSMAPIIEDGWLIFYSRDPEPDTTAVVGKTCVVKLHDGRMLLKQVRRGPTSGRFNLISINAPMIENVELEWAAPVRAMMPPDLAEPEPEADEENGEAA